MSNMNSYKNQIDNSSEVRILLIFLGFLSMFVCLEVMSLEYFYLSDVSFLDVRSLTSTTAIGAPTVTKISLNSATDSHRVEDKSPSAGHGHGHGGHDVGLNQEDGNGHGHGHGHPNDGKSDAQNDPMREKMSGNSKATSDENSKMHIRPLETILQKARVEVTEDIRKSLPAVDGVERLYGNKPVIIGLDQCEIFQKNVPVGEEFISPAGMFNTGTNLLEQMLRKNCILPHREAKYGKRPINLGIKYQVPWGKHSPVSYKYEHVAPTFEGLNPDYFFPALVVKDPYTWMDSMCRHKYAANWNHFGSNHCPNLVATTNEEKLRNGGKDVVEVKVHYRDTKVTHHTSLAHLWNDYYRDWMKADFPKLVVRFEDLLFHAEEVVTKVCECGRGQMRKGPFMYEVDSAKKGRAHSGSNGLIRSMVKYATVSNRLKSMKPRDLEYAMEQIDKDLMELYHYSQPSL